MNKKKKPINARRRFITGISIGLLLAMSVAFISVPIHKALAFPGEALAAAVWKEARDSIRTIASKAWTASKEAIKLAKDVAFKNALRVYLTKVAEDTATYIAAGGTGQKPLFLTKPGKYFNEVGDAALGDYLDSISTGAFGTSICDIGPVKIKVDLALRAELNPNFCTDGCQRSYEKKLASLDDEITYRDFIIQENYDSYVAEQKPQIVISCAAHPDQVSCDADPQCLFSPSGCLIDPDYIIDRPMTCDEGYSEDGHSCGSPSPEPYYQLYLLGAGGAGPQNLHDALIVLNEDISAQQQQAQYDQQRCIRLCTGAKRSAKCTFTQIRERTVAAYNASEFKTTYPQIFEANQNEVGQYLFAYESSREDAAIKKQQAKDAITFGGILAVKSPVTEQVTTPSTLTEAASKKPIEEAGKDTTTYTGSPIADAIGVFTDTLTKKLIERIFNPAEGGFSNPSTGSLLAGGYNSGGIAAARAQFAKAFTPNLTRQSSTNVDALSVLQEDDVLDADFAEAARQEMTVEQAIAEGRLHGDWWFGYNDKGANGEKTEPMVGNGGYPASTFPILRTNRILPVGWEVAAEYINQYDTGSYKLNDVIEAFDDPTSPFYQLVDPKWVLEAPAAVCAKQGYSGKLVDGSCQSSDVVTVSNDNDPDCKAGEHDTNNDGSCNDEDPPIYENTCERDPVCVDQQTCIQETQDGQGCEQYGYCTKELPIWRFQGEQCDQQYESCQGYTTTDGNTVSYLTNSVDSQYCSSDNVGCQRYCYKDIATGQYTCQYNPSTGSYTGDQIYFDDDVENCSAGDAGCTGFLRTSKGANILPNSSFELYTHSFPVTDQATFTGWTIGGNNQTCGAQAFTDQLASSGSTSMRLQQLPAANACVGDPHQYAEQVVDTGQFIDGKSYTFSFNALALNAPCVGSVTIGSQTFTPTFTDSYQRFVATTTFPIGSATTLFTVRINSIDSCPLIIDDAKVEQGSAVSAYRNYGDDAIYMKDAPPSLVCTGNPLTDDAECSKYATQCTEAEVGCNAFTPVGGGTVIPGKVTDPSQCDPADPTSCDQCPAAFLGCRAYKEIALTQKIPDPALGGRTPLPGNEYVSVVAESGTQCTAQYVGCEEYTNLDAANQGGESKEYYTKVRQCVTPSDPNAAYYFSWVGSASTGFELKRWHLKESNLNNAPCTNLQVTASPNAACIDAPATVNDCSAEFPSNPSCVQFYDESGGVHYRYLDEVIFVTENCSAYRNTIDDQTYYFDSTQSTTCPATFAGCREYKGAGANNTKTLFTSTFEDAGDPSGGWNLTAGSVAVSTESLAFPGHSLSMGSSTQTRKNISAQAGKTYVVSFWAKSGIAGQNSNLAMYLEGAADTPNAFSWNGVNMRLLVTDQWQRYTLGPVTADWMASAPQYIAMFGYNGAPVVYIDNIELKETTTNVFLVKDSAPTCNGYENCAQYTEKNGGTQNLKSFTKLCSQSVLGCEALIDTHNSTTPFQTDLATEQKYLQTSRANYSNIVPADSVRFLVNDPTKYCSQSAKGCQELALPTIGQNLAVTGYQTVYLKNDPDTFNTTLCSKDAVGCQQYTQIEDRTSIDYFKNPQSRVCEYRENVGSTKQTGWFAQGTDTLCDASWVHSCPIEQSTCREYFAPRVYENPATPNSQSYYYLDSSLTKNACPQGIDPRNGCLGFEDKNAGYNTLRPKIDTDNSDAVLSQSCEVCSSDTASCGRNGSAPCCKWDGATCSIDRAAGTDDVAPYYCIFELQASGFEQCQVAVANSYAVPNSADAATATNCGKAGQPNCFLPDLSDYDASIRYCGDFACNANVVLPVKEDRICDQWLECTNEQKVTRDGKETTVCLERTLRDRNGYIPEGYGDNTKKNLEKSSPAEIKDLANYSGLTKAGMIRDNGSGSLIVEGLFPYSQFTEDGLDGALIEISNSDFEDTKISVSESPMPISEIPVLGRGWIDAQSFTWRTTRDLEGAETSHIQLEKSNTSTNFSNQYLAVISASTGENGVRASIDNPDEITDNAQYYQLSFRARAKHVLQQGIRANIYQERAGELFSDGSSAGIALTTEWQDYVVRLYNNPGATVNPTVQNMELRFLHRAGNVPSDTFYIDDVQLKPVLQIRDGITKQPVSGLSAQYFQAKLVPATGSIAGLKGSFWNSIQNFNPPPPTPAPTYQFTSPQINYPWNAGGLCEGNNVGRKCLEDNACGTGGTCNLLSNMAQPYTVQWTGGIYITNSDINRFYFNHDDGARLYIEDMNIPILDNWNRASSLGTDATLRDMPEGWHPVKVEWFNSAAYGGIQWGWHEGAGGLPYLVQTDPASEFPNPPCPQAQAGPYAQVCDNGAGGNLVPQDKLTSDLTVDLDNMFETGTLYSSANDKTVNFPNFNDRLTEQANRGDAVGVRWSGEINIPADGSYTFYLYHKDGIKFYIDNEFTPKIEDWAVSPNPATLTTYTTGLEKGYHTIKIEYFKGLDQNRDVAVMEFGWNYPDPTAPAMSSGPGHIVTEQFLRSYPTSPTGFVARECRSYPQSDSLVCDYEDPQSGVLYRGWKGYCVEKDPRDSTVCLNWWPIDALSGEVNVFADQDLSLTRSPLYYCAETRRKPEPFSVPRYTCLSTHISGSDGGPEPRCATIAVAYDILPAGYELDPSDGWVYGGSDPGATLGNCDVYPGNSTAQCCEVKADVDPTKSTFNGTSCTSAELFRAGSNAGDARIVNQTGLDNCLNELKKYYGSIEIRNFTDDGGRYDEGCGGDNDGDDNGDCNNGNDDCHYRQLDIDNSYTFFGDTYYAGNNWVDDFKWVRTANYPEAFSFPRQCTTIIQVTKADGTSVPWTARIQSGLYGATGEEHPLLYSLGTACAPYGGIPVISKPSDIVNCVPSQTNPPRNGCTVTSGVCSKVNSSEPGECVPAPLEIYHPNNPDDGNVSQICSQTRLGAGFYSCGGADGICKTCIGGDRNGLMCNDETDCPNAEPQDFDGDGTLDSPCYQTFGTDEVLGAPDDTLAPPLANEPTDLPTQTAYSGIARIKQLFAQSYGMWSWDNTNDRYVRVTNLQDWTPPIDNGVLVSSPSDKGGVCLDDTYHTTHPNVYCGIRPTVSNIKVNGQTSGDIILSSGSHTTNLEFNYAIDAEQTPMKNITIDWGDSQPKSVYHTSTATKLYRCDAAGESCISCYGGIVPTDIDNDGTTECVYDQYPKIQVKDNWGWCNIRSTSTAAGCIAGSEDWDNYNGRIIVKP